ncbi:MAG: hypothetical protein KJO53_08795, partial [Eudoraea sp.]|nr:hypothetical protein [Eudoraea sp.]
MKFTSSLRRNIFWIKDFLAGSTVRTDYVDIKHSLSLSSFKQLQKKNEPLLHNLLSMATESTEFYKSYGDFKSLQDFPVINKLIIREHFEEITIPQKRARDQFSVFTSGSTGTPFSIYQTKRKKIRNTADTLYFANSTGYTLGDKLFYIRKWTHFYRKNWLISKLQNIVPIDIDDLNDTYISNLIEKLKKDKSPKSWLGYPSS